MFPETSPSGKIRGAYAVSASVRCTCSSDGGVAVDLTSSQMYQLNSAGALILKLLLERRSEIDIATEVARRCQVSEARVMHDLPDFFARLEREHMIYVVRDTCE
jgi:hypothetical protein